MLNALNEVMRESYLKDCEIGLKRWNRMIERAGHALRLTLPSLALPPLDRRLGRACPWIPQGSLVAKEFLRKTAERLDPVGGPTGHSCSR